jgi:murein DD-endopeptidase MepM/ murein hydrolase activator NlpD
LKTGLLAKFPAREIYLRSAGEVKFFTISTRLQLGAASLALLALGGWAAATLFMVAGQADLAVERAMLDAQSKAVASKQRQVSTYSRSVGEIAADLKERQDFLEDTTKSIMGGGNGEGAVVGKAEATPVPAAAGKKISAAVPEARPLLALEQRQLSFARRLTGAIAARTKRAEQAIRSFGLNPLTLARRPVAQGGPFIPWKGDSDGLDGEMKQLSLALARLDVLEASLVAIPSGKPTAAPMLSSSYGYRRDPFTGAAAFHSGLDFPGSYGQPILAAAGGRVSYVGPRQGYGNVVEVDHGNGLMTRYAHLSGFGTKVGSVVTRGQPIARMGSTGRSTGTHLHFEVRLNGAAINPRRFLEATQDVLQVQQIAKARFADVGNRG